MASFPQTTSTRATITLDHVWIAAALALLALKSLLTPIAPHDFWWHLATGRLIATHGVIPTTDVFSYTQAGAPFYNQGWLAQLLMYGLYQLGGAATVALTQALVIVSTYGLLLWLCVRRTGRLRLSVGVLLLSLPLVFDNWQARPQSYAFPLFVAFLAVLTGYRLGWNRRLWLLPPLIILWANIHGSFVLGLALIGITFVGEIVRVLRGEGRQTNDERRTTNDERRTTADERRTTNDERQKRSPLHPFTPSPLHPLITWGLLTALATLINPRGFALLGYVRDLLGTNAVTALVTEWAPPTIRETSGLIFFLFLFVCGLALTYARRRPDPTDLLLFGAFLWLALGAGRNIVWFGFVAVPLLVTQLATLLPVSSRRSPGSSALNATLIGLLALLVVGGLPWIKPALFPPSVGAVLATDTPVEAVEALQAQPHRPQRLFHSEGYGSYLIWAAPEQPVFIDPRIELYPYAQWRDYINLSQGIDVDALIAKYDFDGLLLDKQIHTPLIERVRSDSAWVVGYEDEGAVYFQRAR
jgi:hypothetical protein